MSLNDFNDILPEVKSKLCSQLSEESSNDICKYIDKGELTQFLILLIKNKNCTLLQFLWTVFKDFDKIRMAINSSMIHLILSSLDESITFFEIFKWYEEFGSSCNQISSNIVTVIYLRGISYPLLKPSILKLIGNQDNLDNVNNRTIFFIYDEIDIIKPYINNNMDDVKRYMIRAYWYDAINTLIEIQKINKLPFYSIGWYLLSTPVFNQVISKYNQNIYDDIPFSDNFAKYICISNRWEFLPDTIPKLTESMWKHIKTYFYMGYLTTRFVMVLFHQLKKHNISITILKSNVLEFNSASEFVEYLKQNNYYSTFSTEKLKYKLREKIDFLKDDILDASIVSATTMMVIFDENNFNSLNEIVFDCSLYLSNRYNTEINYIDFLLKNDGLGWDNKMIDTYSKFKKLMSYIIDQANIGQQLATKFNSYLPLENIEFNIPYRLRIINTMISIYNKLKIKKFQEEYNMIYTNCIALKVTLVNDINILSKYYINTNKTTHQNSINNLLSDLIDNCDSYTYSKRHYNQNILDLLKYNTYIQSLVKLMLDIFQIPIQDILPILQKFLLVKETVVLS
jgi:hypothetical protein